ncbi:type II toxin-antitoxin system RelE family toxin [Desulfatirhabdium butyrativorans]|uniref:type II toxin-antitoxin system RelE family toxin n=1 Tax=Desulfatirhabdium butyrativorans TaxID=340467 RepID=UPI0003F790E1|nr:type II toxin-antitoxin system RelE/ParE family toxin [Desulfatirhabdium butyrativorans]
MPFSLRYHPDVKTVDLPLIDNKMKQRIKKAIEERLVLSPQDYGQPLRKTLKGYWKLRVGDFRIVFKVVESEIRILGIRQRKDIYLEIPDRLS